VRTSLRDDHTGYRPDIDGLRAVAVASVLVFHAFPGALPGGFVGVDIFFVISGYLISGIILRDLASDRFTFRDFYVRRVRRIFPALGLVLLATLLVGWWGLLPADFRQLGVHVAGGVGFVSNLLLWAETGYFDVAAELKPLLHLWSLGVEEQYYLLWPVGLFIFRRHVHRIFWLILAVALASFAANIVATDRFPDAAFYWPIPRFWELMVGSIIAYAQMFRPEAGKRSAARWSGVLSTAGVLLLLAALLLLHPKRTFPGWWALLPTSGAALLICAGPSAWFNRMVLSNRAMVYIGLISYPLYLWHWPLLAFARIFNGSELPPAGGRIALLLAAVALAVATYELLEKKIRRARHTAWSPRVVPALLTTLAVLGLYGLLVAGRHAQSRSAAVPQLTAISEAFDDWDYGGDRLIRGNVDQRVLFFGDSHMQQYLPRIEWLMKHHERPVRTVQFSTQNGCAPFPGVERPGRNCAGFVQRSLATARSAQVDTVVVGSSWQGFITRDDYFKVGEEHRGPALDLGAPANQWVFDEFEAALLGLVRAGKHVVIVGSSPRGPWFNPRTMVRKEGLDFVVTPHSNASLAEVRAQTAVVDARLRGIAERTGATLVDPMDTICSATECPALDAAGNPLYKDESHLRSSVVRERFDALDPFVYTH